MKKIIASICLLIVATTAAKAQWFTGLELGYGSQSSVSHTFFDEKIKHPSRKIFTLTPRIGHIFSEKWSAGLGIGVSWSKKEHFKVDGKKYKNYSQTLSFAPYLRWNFISFGPLSAGLEGTFVYSASTVKDSELKDRVKSMEGKNIAVYISPVLQFDIMKRISLESRLNFLSLGYYRYKDKYKDYYENKRTYRSDSFGFSLSGDEVFTTSTLTLGAIFKF